MTTTDNNLYCDYNHENTHGLKVWVRGIVQGVGFRPFVYGLAMKYNLKGWVCNTSSGVEIEVAGSQEALQAFYSELKSEYPPLARIDEINRENTIRYAFKNNFSCILSECIHWVPFFIGIF